MADFNKVLWALDNEIQPFEFERLCVDLLAREGYFHIVPIGGSKDHGRDAELRFWKGSSVHGSVIAFQFSLQDSWEKKLLADAEKIAANCPNASTMVFVSSQSVTGTKQDQLPAAYKLQRNWDLTVYSREWLRHRLTEFHQDLAKKYLGLDLPPTIGSALTLADLSSLDEKSFTETFQQTSPELVRATILESTRKEPSQVGNWYKLARIEFFLRNYDAALEALIKGFKLKPRDPGLVLNMSTFKGAVLAELGMQDRSLPLLIEAKNIFENAVANLKRAGDHFNLANVLGAIGERKTAGEHYHYGVSERIVWEGQKEGWKDFMSEIGVRLLEQVSKDWKMIKPK